MDTVMTWAGPTLDVLVVALLAALLWRLGREPGAAWGEREARLRAIFDDLRTLVAQSEGLARDFDHTLAGREERLRALLAEAQTTVDTRGAGAGVTPTARPGRSPRGAVRDGAAGIGPAPARHGSARTDMSEPAGVAAQIAALAAAGSSVDEIARRLGIATAEVRLVVGLQTARAARRRAEASATEASATEARAHAS